MTAAIASGRLDRGRLEAWRRALREHAWLERRLDKRAASEQRARWIKQSRSLRHDTW